jgi:hypothetical protein
MWTSGWVRNILMRVHILRVFITYLLVHIRQKKKIALQIVAKIANVTGLKSWLDITTHLSSKFEPAESWWEWIRWSKASGNGPIPYEQNFDNTTLRCLPFFSHFVLRAGNWYLFSESGTNFPCVIQNDWKTANFAGLYYPHFTTFRNETSEYY